MKTLLKHQEALELVYGVIGLLKSNGKTKITISEVSRVSGVSRATINSKHEDWVEVRDVILNNKPSNQVKLASIEINERTKWQIEASRLESELQECHERLAEITEFAQNVYKKLLDQLHRYVYLAKEVPEKRVRESKTLIELHELRSRLEYYELEIKNLKAKSASNATVLPFIKRQVIEVYPEDQRVNLINSDLASLTIDAMYKLDSYFKGSNPPRAVYVLCGNFASGKSSWISEHKQTFQGPVVYFEGTNHSEVLRINIVKYIRNLNSSLNLNCQVICVRIKSDLAQCLKRNVTETRVRYKNTISAELINTIGKYFEEVTVEEGFDAIIAIGGK